MVAALLLTLLSVFMSLLLIERTTIGLRVANVVQRVDREAREVFDTVRRHPEGLPAPESDGPADHH